MPPPHSPLRRKRRIWRIDRLHGPRSDYVGIVTARDGEMAIERACEKFGITDPEHRKQLVAREL